MAGADRVRRPLDRVLRPLARVEPRASALWRTVAPRLPPGVRRRVHAVGAGARSRLGLDPAAPAARPPQAPPGPDDGVCPICDTHAPEFLPFGARTPAPDRKCPGCGSLERHRTLWLYLQAETDLFREPVRMLHIAPETFFASRLSRQPNIDYLTADLSSSLAMVQMDITAIDRPDASFDVIYASHVLEHIPDDRAAMGELFRVLAPGGWAILQVPIWGPTTREDPTVTDPDERTRLYGQFDHVRMYGHDGEYQRRLEAAGFTVTVDAYASRLPPETVRRHRLMAAEDIYLCQKPAPTGP